MSLWLDNMLFKDRINLLRCLSFVYQNGGGIDGGTMSFIICVLFSIWFFNCCCQIRRLWAAWSVVALGYASNQRSISVSTLLLYDRCFPLCLVFGTGTPLLAWFMWNGFCPAWAAFWTSGWFQNASDTIWCTCLKLSIAPSLLLISLNSLHILSWENWNL